MKKGFILLFVVFGFVSVTIISSCKKAEVASPVVVKTDQSATISGLVEAQLEEDTTAINWETAPSGTTIFLKIAKQDLNPNAPADEFFVYETTVDGSGNYSVSVPATMAGINVQITLDEFEYDKILWNWELVGSDWVWVSSTERYVYTANPATVNSILPGQNKIQDFQYAGN